jgi:hypothetical protein
MKIRTLMATILGLLLISGLSLSQESMSPEPNLQEPLQVEASPEPVQPEPRLQESYAMESSKRLRSSRDRSSSNQMVMKIFELKYADAENLASLIKNIFRIDSGIVYRSNSVVVIATPEQMESIEKLIDATDVPNPEGSSSCDAQNLVYRIYMFEGSSGDESMKSFSMILRTTTHVSSQELLDTAADKDLQISEFLQSNDFDEPDVEILIQGKVTSNESLNHMVRGLAPKSYIIEMKWDDEETFTNNIAAAQYTQLPEQMQKHIRKFLGDKIKTVGYWFGNSSVPGEVEAPIGPWMLRLELNPESDRTLELHVEVHVPEEISHFDRRLGREQYNEILSNTVRAKIGKPIIIGYNRQSYGTRKMGAMVIIPEADMIQLEENKK